GHTQILAIGLQDTNEFNMKTMNAFTYFDRMVSMILTKMTKYAIANASDACYSIVIPVQNDISMLDKGGSAHTRMKMFQKGYRFVEEYVQRIQPKKLVPNSKVMPITRQVLMSCLDTHGVKVLLRAMKEDPALLDSCLHELHISLPKREGQALSPKQEISRPIIETPKVSTLIIPKVASLMTVEPKIEIPAANELVRISDMEEAELIEIPRRSNVFGPVRPPANGMFNVDIRFSFDPVMIGEILNFSRIGLSMFRLFAHRGDKNQRLEIATASVAKLLGSSPKQIKRKK
ncbi:MAG: hypothetical protein ACMG6E_07340, partial [Candidatus Roizmanbacteria bacterium]